MSDDERTLGQLYDDAGGTEDGELELNGVRFRKTVCGSVLVDGRDLGELSSHRIESVARQLRAAADDKYLDPSRNEFIKLD